MFSMLKCFDYHFRHEQMAQKYLSTQCQLSLSKSSFFLEKFENSFHNLSVSIEDPCDFVVVLRDWL